MIFYDRLVDPDVLELARRDAERVYVGKAPGATAWPQERINGVIVAAARSGKRVVRLKCGDPGIFARGAEEGAALDAAGIAWEIVPGVTAASAAAADLEGSLTERGRIDTLVLATGQVRPGDPPPDWAGLARPGTTVALYMAVGAAADLRAVLPTVASRRTRKSRSLHVPVVRIAVGSHPPWRRFQMRSETMHLYQRP